MREKIKNCKLPFCLKIAIIIVAIVVAICVVICLYQFTKYIISTNAVKAFFDVFLGIL
jgi:hypothetical protein